VCFQPNIHSQLNGQGANGYIIQHSYSLLDQPWGFKQYASDIFKHGLFKSLTSAKVFLNWSKLLSHQIGERTPATNLAFEQI
jgi:hypothetical protein